MILEDDKMTTQQLQLSEEQEHFVTTGETWFNTQNEDSADKEYYLAGYAGTGKTTVVQYFIDKVGLTEHEVAFACFTGKASLVLSQKLKKGFKAMTLHKLVYKPYTDPQTKQVIFVRKSKMDLAHLKLIIVDEASMVDNEMKQDLESFGIPVMYVGDHGQLPPISGDKNVVFQRLMHSPNARLTKIQRQAEGNPIIELSMLARTKQNIAPGWYGENREVLVMTKAQWFQWTYEKRMDVSKRAHQIICGYNRSRTKLNNEMREYLGFTSKSPQVGDKLICTKNNWNKSIPETSMVNGLTGYVTKTGELSSHKMRPYILNFKPDFAQGKFQDVLAFNEPFNGQMVPKFMSREDRKQMVEFDYGYAITCHKSQGSQWDQVLIFNEAFGKEPERWLYTAITRAAKRMILVL